MEQSIPHNKSDKEVLSDSTQRTDRSPNPHPARWPLLLHRVVRQEQLIVQYVRLIVSFLLRNQLYNCVCVSLTRFDTIKDRAKETSIKDE